MARRIVAAARNVTRAMRVHVAFTPAEAAEAPTGLVVDVLRATSTIAQALASGYGARPVLRRDRGGAGRCAKRLGERASSPASGRACGSRASTAATRRASSRTATARRSSSRRRTAPGRSSPRRERCDRVYAASLLNLGAVVAAARRGRGGRRRRLRRREGRVRLDDAVLRGTDRRAALDGEPTDAGVAAMRLASAFASVGGGPARQPERPQPRERRARGRHRLVRPREQAGRGAAAHANAGRRGRDHALAVVVHQLDVRPVGIEHERAVVARVVDRPLAGRAVVR